MTKYDQSSIYKICCNDPLINDIYIGSTTNFKHRKYCHKNSCINENDKRYNSNVYQFIRINGGWTNWNMIEVEKYNASDKRELEKRERYWLETLKATLNKRIPTRTKKEWSDENKEKLKERNKEYYKTNKEKIKEQKKEYRENNKEEKKEYNKEYQEKNRETIKKQSKEYYINNKEKLNRPFDCELCGGKYKHRTIAIHLKTKKHKLYQEIYDFICS